MSLLKLARWLDSILSFLPHIYHQGIHKRGRTGRGRGEPNDFLWPDIASNGLDAACAEHAVV